MHRLSEKLAPIRRDSGKAFSVSLLMTITTKTALVRDLLNDVTTQHFLVIPFQFFVERIQQVSELIRDNQKK